MQRSNQTLAAPSRLRCAIYTRKSTEEGLDQEFNSLDAHREAAEAFIRSQRREGWVALPEPYDDPGFTGANMDRPALKKLLKAVEARELDCVVVYKVDRLSRSLLDFTRILSIFETHNVSFVAVTQQFNTSTSLGRLTLNILLSFAQFERELIGERTRDKMSAARRKGKWVGGTPVLGYDVDPLERITYTRCLPRVDPSIHSRNPDSRRRHRAGNHDPRRRNSRGAGQAVRLGSPARRNGGSRGVGRPAALRAPRQHSS